MQEPLLIGLMIWHILAVSDNHKHFQTAIDEYLKRSEKNIDLHLLKPSRKDDPISVRREETMALIKILEKKPKPIILLSID
ncbi:MAG: hypothetical protein Q8O99_02480 [bacterium]|nr:hypothetical protein [bacterium]